MEQFNLERALAGEPVITRNGKEVTQLVRFECDRPQKIWGVVEGELHSWYNDGTWYNHTEGSIHDIFMKPKENAIWLNVYKDRDSGNLFVGQAHREEEWAKLAIDSTHAEHIKTIKIDDKK